MTEFLTLFKKLNKPRKVIWLLACLENVLILANNIIIYGSFVQIVRNILLKCLVYNWRLIANHSVFWSDSLWLRSKYNCGHEKFTPNKVVFIRILITSPIIYFMYFKSHVLTSSFPAEFREPRLFLWFSQCL